MDKTAQDQQGQPTPVSPPQKEQESITPTQGGYLERVERQPEIPPEVAKIGVQPVSGPTLTAEDKKVGITEAKEEVPVSTEPEGLVQLPLTEREARNVLKIHKNIAEAIVWLANFILRQFKIIKLKKGEEHGSI